MANELALAKPTNLSPALKSINKGLDKTIQNFEILQSLSKNVIEVTEFQVLGSEVADVNKNLATMTAEIDSAAESQDRLAGGMQQAGQISGLLKSAMGSITSQIDLQKIVEMSDKMTQMKAKLGLIKDEGQSVAQVQSKIYEAAQRSGAEYMAMSESVAQLGLAAGDAFKGTDEMVAFAETFQKMGALSGMEPTKSDAAMGQITQSMQSGSMGGNEFAELMTSAPLAAQAIEDYVGVSTAEMQSLANEGVITADVIKNAMFMASAGVNEEFGQLPVTWSQIWTDIKNGFLLAMQPILEGISIIAQNWSIIGPIVLGVAAAIGAYVIAMQAMALFSSIATIAQSLLNKELAISPLGMIVMLIGLIVAAIAKWVQSVGGLQVAWLTVVNGLLNACESMKIDALTLFQELVNGAIDLINKLIETINHVPGVEIEASIEHVDLVSDSMNKHIEKKQQRELKLEEAKRNAESTTPDWSTYDPTSPSQPNGLGSASKSMPAGINTIADNTTRMADSVSASEEDLKYLLDIAERDTINRFTTAEVRVEMSNSFGDIRESADIDGVINRLTEKLEQQLAMTAEGVHM